MVQVIVAVVVPAVAATLVIVAGVESLISVTIALADFELSVALVAVMVTVCPVGMDDGADRARGLGLLGHLFVLPRRSALGKRDARGAGAHVIPANAGIQKACRFRSLSHSVADLRRRIVAPGFPLSRE